MKKSIGFLVLLGWFGFNSNAHAVDLSTQFALLRSAVDSMPVASDRKVRIQAIVTFTEEQVNAGLDGKAVNELLEAAVAEMWVAMMESSAALTEFGFAQPAGTPMDPLFEMTDEIAALLYFQSLPMVHDLPPLPTPPLGDCSVRILWSSLARLATDPKGTIWAPVGHLLQLEAEASEPGGTYDWELGPPQDKFRFSDGKRFSYRAVHDGTSWVSVTYFAPSGGACRDTIFVKVQGLD